MIFPSSHHCLIAVQSYYSARAHARNDGTTTRTRRTPTATTTMSITKTTTTATPTATTTSMPSWQQQWQGQELRLTQIIFISEGKQYHTIPASEGFIYDWWGKFTNSALPLKETVLLVDFGQCLIDEWLKCSQDTPAPSLGVDKPVFFCEDPSALSFVKNPQTKKGKA